MLTYMVSLFFLCAHVSTSPNFVLILTDDQDLLLNGLVPMKNTLDLVANRGKVFENAYVSSPICCPSRSTILTGKYAHNTGVVNNSIEGNCSSRSWQQKHELYSVASILKLNGYNTFYAGKYLNQYGSKQSGGVQHVPFGYDWWFGLKGNSKYYNYTLSMNGTRKFYKNDYLTDVLANYSTDFLNNRVRSQPFFMVVAPPASHAPFTPAKRHELAFPGTKAFRNPSFNCTPVEKHWLVGMPPNHLPTNVTILDNIQRHRLQSLLAVDELVETVVKKLVQLQELNNTYIIFMSDNGFHIGQFTQPWDKRQPYETDVRVPMMITGPGIPIKTLESYPVSSVDIAPTILDLADLEAPSYMDGTSFKKVLFSGAGEIFKKSVFVEYWGEGNVGTVDSSCPWKFDQNLAECTNDGWCKCQDSRNNTYTCVITVTNSEKFKFCSFKDDQNFVEAYNHTDDPHELRNIYSKMNHETVKDYFALLNNFKECSGRTC